MNKTTAFFNRCLLFSALCSLISSFSLTLIPIVSVSEDRKILGILISIVFWAGLVGEQFFVWSANTYRKRMEHAKGRFPKKVCGRPGIISVFTTPEGLAADILFTVSLTAFIVVSVMKIGEDVLQYALISCVILSFRLHCLLNGINYRYSKKIKKEGKRDAKNS